jgi:8-oxo-dGTP diphosphatase
LTTKTRKTNSVETKELAGVVIYNEQGELLLIHRNTRYLTQWELPGGKVEEGESVHDTATREALEEISVNVAIGEVIGKASFVGQDILWNYTWLSAEIGDGQEPQIGEPHTFDGLAYFSLDALRNKTSEISPNVANFLKYMDNNSTSPV